MASVTKRGNSYRFRCSVGYDEKGKQIFKSRTWKIPALNPDTGRPYTEKAAEKEAYRRAALFEEEVRKGLVMNGHIKFSECAARWNREYAQPEFRATTYKNMPHRLEVINAAIGHIYIDQLKYAHLRTFYAELERPFETVSYICVVDLKQYLKEHKILKKELLQRADVSEHVLRKVYSGDNLTHEQAAKIADALNCKLTDIFKLIKSEKKRSKGTIRAYQAIISMILSWAVELELIPFNVAMRKRQRRNIGRKKEAYSLDDEETRRLLTVLKLEPVRFRTAITVLIYTGMRRGELLGLKWSDIDFENGIININKTISYAPDLGVHVNLTKNSSSERYIKVSPQVIAALKELRLDQAQKRLMLGSAWLDTGFIFTGDTGAVMHPDTISNEFKKFKDKNGFSPELHLHSLRHTAASLMIAAGVDLVSVAHRLGHSDASTTSKIYAHAIQKADARASEVLDDIFNKKTI